LGALSLDILGPALVAGILILATHVPLGTIVLGRGIIFIDIALAQVAALGVVFGTLMWGAASFWVIQLAAVTAAIGCAGVLTWTDRNWPHIQEAIIGVIYVFAAAAQIILLAYSVDGAEYLKKLLVGQILWVTPGELVVVALLYACVFAIWYFRDLSKEKLLFYAVFAVVITASVQIVGVLLVFASLIVPALATLAAPPGWRLAIAFNIGVLGYFGGIVASAILDLPTGAAIVCVLIVIALFTAILLTRTARSRGEVPANETEPHGETGHGGAHHGPVYHGAAHHGSAHHGSGHHGAAHHGAAPRGSVQQASAALEDLHGRH
jgi:zinc/manganese transport system permease protein